MVGYTAFSWSLSNEKLFPYTLESITVWSRGHRLYTQSRKIHIGRTHIHFPEGGDKEIPHSTPPAALHPWSIRDELSTTHSQVPLPGWSGWGLRQEPVPLEERGSVGAQPWNSSSPLRQHLHLPEPRTSFWDPPEHHHDAKSKTLSYNAALSAVFSHGDFPLISVGMILRFGATVGGTWEKKNLQMPYNCALCCALKHVITLKCSTEFDNK